MKLTLQSWRQRLAGLFSDRTRQRADRRCSLDIEQLEERDTPSASLLGGAALMQPTYQLFQAQVKLGGQPTVSPMGLPAGYSPAQIRTAYGVNKILFKGNLAGDGSGETIAIVDAFDDPTAASDLTAFDQEYGLQSASFTKVGINAGGNASTSSFPIADPDWSIEIALDVEWAHAIAPKANILLVEANSNSYVDLMNAVNYARNYTGVAVVSMSWGGSEFAGETAYESNFTTPAGHSPVTFFASAGDSGTPAILPSVLPNVVSVGGTSLTLAGAGNWVSESGWSDGGGGISTYITQPSYQDNLTIYGASADGMRATPDVAYNADPDTGVAVLSTYGYGGWLQVGGTSAGSPQWAAILAITDQGRALAGEPALDGATQTLPDLYNLPSTDFHDITSGNNGLQAGPGYDLVTGLGTPIANFVVPDLAGTPQVMTNLAVTPANAIVGDNNQRQFSAIALDQFGKPMVNQPSFSWSVLSGLGSVDANGVYTAPTSGSGTATVEAIADVNNVVYTSSATLSYQPGPSIDQVGASPSIVTGNSTTLSAQVSDLNSASLTYVWWVVNEPAGATTPYLATPEGNSTTVNFFQAGAYEFEFGVTDGANVTATALVNVTVTPTLTSIMISATTFTLTNGARQQLIATAWDQFAMPLAVQPAFAWSVVNGAGSVDANGAYTAPSAGAGTDTVSATGTVNGITVSGTASVNYGAVLAITNIGATPSVLTGTTTTVSANVIDPESGYVFEFWYGLYLPPGGVEPQFADSTSSTTTATFFGPGTYTLSFMAIDGDGNLAEATINVTVVPTLTTVLVTPGVTDLANGAQQQFTAAAYDQFFDPLAATYTWSIANGPGSVDANGLYTAPTRGLGISYVQATASVNGATASGDGYAILQQPPTITSISASANPVNGAATKLSVAAYDPNGAGGVTYLWSVASEPAGAKTPTFTSATAYSTTATFFQAGSYTFQVAVTDNAGLTTLGTLKASVNQVLTSIVVTPATTTVPDGSQQQFSAAAYDQFKQPMAAAFTWSMASGPGSVNSTTELYSAPATGTETAVVKAVATLNGVTLSKTATVTLLAPPTITSISATRPVTGTSTSLKVVAANANGGALTYAWSVLTKPAGAPAPTFSAAAANLTSTTLFQAGTYTFQVAVTNKTGQTTAAKVTVSVNAVLTSIQVTPATASVARGTQQQFAVVAYDQFHNAMSTQAMAWPVTGLGTISTGGLYLAPATAKGTAIIKAKVTSNGISLTGSATVMVV